MIDNVNLTIGNLSIRCKL